MMGPKFFAHESATISNTASVGEGSKIWINVQIRENAFIGKNCFLSKDVYVDHEVMIGNNCKIQNGVSVYHGVSLADNVFVGPNACFTNDRVPRVFDPSWQVCPTIIKEGASIGANATVVCGVTVGEYAMIAAGSVVTKDVAPYSMVMGNPARHVSYVDKMGNKTSEDRKKMRKKPIKIGLIGVGSMGRNHLRVLSMLNSVNLEFIYDPHQQDIYELAEQYDVRVASVLEEELKAIDAVVICSPTSKHAEHIRTSAKYLDNIFVEKPLADSLAQTQELVLFAEENHKKLQVGFIERYNTAVIELKKIIEKDSKVFNIDFTRTSKLSSRITDVDVVLDLMIHDVDIALFLSGPVEHVHAYGVVDNGMIVFASAVLRHENGRHSRLLASRITEKKTRGIQVTSQDSFIDCDLLRKEIVVNRQSTVRQGDNEPYTIVSVEEAVQVPLQEALLNEHQAFADWCHGENVLVPTGGDG
ncbi:putative dehydrogenase, partial [Candidatus Electrothrix marina]